MPLTTRLHHVMRSIRPLDNGEKAEAFNGGGRKRHWLPGMRKPGAVPLSDGTRKYSLDSHWQQTGRSDLADSDSESEPAARMRPPYTPQP